MNSFSKNSSPHCNTAKQVLYMKLFFSMVDCKYPVTYYQDIYLHTVRKLWQYGLSSFQGRDTKLHNVRVPLYPALDMKALSIINRGF